MKKTFIIQEPLFLTATVRATTKEEAFDVFARHYSHDEKFRKLVNSFSPEKGLLGLFACDEHGSFFNEDEDQLIITYHARFNSMSEVQKEKYMNEKIESNIREFWDDKPQLADEYIAEWRKISGNGHDSYNSCGKFSDAFYADVVKRTKWFEEVSIHELTNNEYQLISE
ncbi:hypothetical protein Q7A53_02045 [Halobacillus rhizosphaerae]|uniref:hypothetical protein n=1 Tax=Halobacillus rhizosphaerae TaxID=3064889 RepID=UPI00398AB097